MGLAVAPSTLIHRSLTVGTILHPSCIWTYGLHMAGYAGVSGSVRLTPQNWLNQRQSRNTQRTNIQTPRGSPKPCMCSSHSPCRNECQRGCSRKRRNEQTSNARAAGLRNRKNRSKVADEREISMDYVAIPASYEPPGFEPTPRELQAGWLSTIAPRRCAKRGRREACRRCRRLHAWRRASNLRSPGRSTRAYIYIYYADDV